MWCRAPSFKGGVEAEARRHIGGLERSNADRGSEPDHAASCMSQALMTFIYPRCRSGLERSDIIKEATYELDRRIHYR